MMPLLPHDLTTKTICVTISMCMALGMYIPLFRRLIRRKHTRDFSKTYQWLCFLVQVNNLILAHAEHAPFLMFWYITQAICTGVYLYLVLHYWENPTQLSTQPSSTTTHP
jgi:hypothetical protein